MSAIDDYWIKFLKETNRTANEICSGDINFGSNGFTNDSQIALVLAGNKTAFFSSLASYTIDNEILPVALFFSKDSRSWALLDFPLS